MWGCCPPSFWAHSRTLLQGVELFASQPNARKGELGRDIVLTDSSLYATVLCRRGGCPRGASRGEGAKLFGRSSPGPSTSVHRLMDRNSAIPSLCVFHPIWVFGGGAEVASRGLGHTTCSFPPSTAQNSVDSFIHMPLASGRRRAQLMH